MAAWQKIASGGSGLCAPTFAGGKLLVASQNTGEVMEVQGDALVTMMSCGAPSGLWWDEGVLYVCDMSMQGVLRYENGQLTELVKEYEAKLFKGPSAIAIDKDSNVFFLDAGPLGETTLQSPKGSAFQITADAQLLQPLALECLAHPSALALGPPGSRAVFVAELLSNRVLRFVQRAGAYHCSVFCQLSGRMGPSGMACDAEGNLYVCQYDIATGSATGCVLVISPEGKTLREMVTPAPEVTGIAINGSMLYITEASTNTVYEMAL